MDERITILDFGSQYTQLIARRLRELKVYSVVLPYNTRVDEISGSKGVVLSGGPWSVYENHAPMPDPGIFDLDVPILGICYGLQVIGKMFGGSVVRSLEKEFGSMVFEPKEDPLFTGLSPKTIVWMSHGDRLTELPHGFKVIGRTKNSKFASVRFGKVYGLQFHPEVTHTKEGKKILQNFLYSICKIRGDWTSSSFVEIAREEISSSCKEGRAVLAYSGGVDSTVCSVLAREILGDKFTPIFVDTGLMRKGEVQEIKRTSEELNLRVRIINAEGRFLKALQGVVDPEKKRMIIGREFASLFEEEATRRSAEYLIQGTLYPDRIESVSDIGPSHTIKTHHNVGAMPKDLKLILVEPLKDFFKDEVRKVAKILNIPEKVYRRHPFPGPGLAVRITGEVTKERLEILREADWIFIETLKELELYDSIWQAFAVFIPVRTVGVIGDQRTYGNLIGLRAVKSKDGMTADWFPFKKKDLDLIARRIMNEVSGVNRVVYDVSSKPPATIEWE
ncbi:MAG: glutamine-hydrolyzing GMP synthase [candidate division WOR-3 bacterium]|nr:glutamine-hydrolyzing GMP synthase [candidate division WOR-3 bacterium]